MFVECKGIERDILISLKRKSKSISQISKELNKSIQTISKTIERIQEQDLIIKIHNYKKDARKTEISINPKRVKIEKTHTLYLKYYILISISLIFSGISSIIIKNFFLILGSIIIALPLFLIMLYEVYTKEDTTIVEKNPKTIKKEINKEETEKVDIVD